MKKIQYLVRINKDPTSDWGASVPDLPGCVATGKSIDVTLRRIERAITLHLRGMREDGIKPPPARHRSVVPKRVHGAKWIFMRRWKLRPNLSLSIDHMV